MFLEPGLVLEFEVVSWAGPAVEAWVVLLEPGLVLEPEVEIPGRTRSPWSRSCLWWSLGWSWSPWLIAGLVLDGVLGGAPGACAGPGALEVEAWVVLPEPGLVLEPEVESPGRTRSPWSRSCLWWSLGWSWSPWLIAGLVLDGGLGGAPGACAGPGALGRPSW